MPIFSSTIQDHVANTMPQPYYRFDGVDDYISVSYQRHGADSGTGNYDISIFCSVKTISSNSTTSYAGNPANTILGDTNGSVRCGFGIHGGKVRATLYSANPAGWTIVDST